MPIWYDFKRSFLRLSVLFTLALFIIGGIALGFTTISLLGISKVSNINAITYLQNENGTLTVIGIVFNNQGIPLAGATVQLVNVTKVIASTTTNSNGIFKLSIHFPQREIIPYQQNTVVQPQSQYYLSICYIKITYNGEVLTTSPSPFLQGQVFSVSKLYYWLFVGGTVFMVQFGNHLIVFPTSNETFTIKYYASYHPLKQVGNYTVKVEGLVPEDILLPVPGGARYVSVYTSNGTLLGNYITVYPYTLQGDEIANIYPSVLFLYSSFFPFVAIYLGYTMFSRPRDKGPLEFLLAMPVTKGELYFNRYTANLLTILVSSVLTNLVAFLFFTTYIGIPPALGIVALETAYLFVYISAYLGLTYMMGGLSKSSELSIAVPIVAFIMFNIMSAVAVFNPRRLWMLYITPVALGDYIENYITKIAPAGGSAVVTTHISLAPSIASAVMWLIIPVIIGYIAFKKENI